jgi:hypothetical protein
MSAGEEAEVRVHVSAAELKAEGAMRIRPVSRHYMSTHFLWTAQHMSALAAAIEEAHSGPAVFDAEHRSYVLSSIIASAAFAEAAINEVFWDAYDEHGLTDDGYLVPLKRQTIDGLAAVWEATDKGRKLHPLEKWQLLLIHAGAPQLDRGAQPYQNARDVFELRNALVHFRPEDVANDEVHRLQARLEGKFDENRLMDGSGNPWWTSRCLGHGCTDWAIRSVEALAGRVADELGLTLNYRRLLPIN